MFENVQQLVETAALGMAAMVFCLVLLGAVFSWLVRGADETIVTSASRATTPEPTLDAITHPMPPRRAPAGAALAIG